MSNSSLFGADAGAQASTLTLASYGDSKYFIVIPAKASKSIKTAADELQLFFAQSTGAKLPIVSEPYHGSNPAIYLGPTTKFRKINGPARIKKLAEDGILIETDGQDLIFSGQNQRGELYSVYVFCEKVLGIRFLAHDCTVVPKKTRLVIKPMHVLYSPPMMYRETLYWDSFPTLMAARQRLNGPYTKCDETVGGKIAFFPYVHSASKLIPPDVYYKEHPEYFSLVGGQRTDKTIHGQICWTNPDVQQIIVKKVMEWADENPDVPIFDVSQNDGEGACECERCMAVVNEEGSQHGPILRMVNMVADEMAKRHPDRWVETLAYAYAMKPPKITRPRPNVIIRLCHAGCYFHGFEKCGLGANLVMYLNEWSKVTKRIFIWHYATNFAHYLTPNQNLRGLAKDIKYYTSHGVNGLMVQANYQGPGGELAELRQYLSAQLMWNPRLDPMAIRREFCKGYYGRADKLVLEFLAMMDEDSERPNVHGFGAWDPKTTVPDTLVIEGLKVLNRALAADSSVDVKRRVRKLMLPLWMMQVTYPESYRLAEADKPTVAANIKAICDECGITHVSEGDGSGASGWLPALVK